MDRGQLRPLRVLIMSQQYKFERVLVANIQNWGHEAIVIPATVSLLDEERVGETNTAIHNLSGENEEYGKLTVEQTVVGDVLLYDLDTIVQEIQLGKDTPILGYPFLETKIDKDQDLWPHKTYSGGQVFPDVRMSIVLSNHSVTRAALERLGAIAVLQKPFEMARLQRYLQVLQRLLCASTEKRVQEDSYGADEQLRILVVDDNAAVASTVQQCLLYGGSVEHEYDVHVAHDGLAALEKYLVWHPHCIVTDLIMPWMDGYQVMRCLAAGSCDMMPAFVVVSALASLERSMKHSSLNGRPIVYVDKPFQVAQLLAAVEQACMPRHQSGQTETRCYE